jgi:hypothetical protein
VEHLLKTGLELRDRYEQGEISERGMRIATGKLEAQTGPDAGEHDAVIRRTAGWRVISNMNGCGCSPSCTVRVWTPPTMRRSARSAAW